MSRHHYGALGYRKKVKKIFWLKRKRPSLKTELMLQVSTWYISLMYLQAVS